MQVDFRVTFTDKNLASDVFTLNLSGDRCYKVIKALTPIRALKFKGNRPTTIVLDMKINDKSRIEWCKNMVLPCAARYAKFIMRGDDGAILTKEQFINYLKEANHD